MDCHHASRTAAVLDPQILRHYPVPAAIALLAVVMRHTHGAEEVIVYGMTWLLLLSGVRVAMIDGAGAGDVANLSRITSSAVAGMRLSRARAHTGYMGRIIGTILGAILAVWLVVTFAGGIFATLKTFLIIALVAMAVFIVVWLVARSPRRD